VKIVTDTNIIFSAILNSNGTIGDLIFNSDNVFEYYSSGYMPYEIDKHWQKLKKISKLTEQQLKESRLKISRKIQFLNEELVPEKIWKRAEETVSDIDIDDTDFVAMAIYLKGSIWTGDKVLYNGLKSKKFKHVYNTAELLKIRDAMIHKRAKR